MLVLRGIVWYCMELLYILWYRIVLHVIALYRMVSHGIVLYLTVLHGIALLGSARGLYLARHLSTLSYLILNSILSWCTLGEFEICTTTYPSWLSAKQYTIGKFFL